MVVWRRWRNTSHRISHARPSIWFFLFRTIINDFRVSTQFFFCSEFSHRFMRRLQSKWGKKNLWNTRKSNYLGWHLNDQKHHLGRAAIHRDCFRCHRASSHHDWRHKNQINDAVMCWCSCRRHPRCETGRIQASSSPREHRVIVVKPRLFNEKNEHIQSTLVNATCRHENVISVSHLRRW